MIKTAIIIAYVAHKIYWKRTHKERKVDWKNFFESLKIERMDMHGNHRKKL